MTIKTQKDLRETIQPYMKDSPLTAQRLYDNFRERFKLTISLNEFMKTPEKVKEKIIKEE